MLISVISPVYEAGKIIDELVKRIIDSVSKISTDFEIILVDDSSLDHSWVKIEENCKRDKRIKGLKLSRNFGQHFAITAGLKYAKGDFVVVLDCDLQDDPKYIPDLYKKIQEGFDIVYAQKHSRRHGTLKDLSAFVFYKLFSWISEYNMNPSIGCYSILNRQVVNSFLKFNDYRRGYLMVLKWLGFNHGFIDVEHMERYKGNSSYSFSKLMRHATILVISYSDKLLRISIYIGVLFSTIAFLGIIYLVYKYFFLGVKEGWTSLMVMVSLVGGLIMLSLGILGLYIGQIFEQVKNRPLFLIQKSVNCEIEDS